MAYARTYPHDPIQEIADEVFIVRGAIDLKPLVRISRNMTIVRRNGQLTLINPVRLSEAAEKELLGLGEVRRILRLGDLHGVDDLYYCEQLGAELWALGPGITYPEPPVTKLIDEESDLDLPGTELFCFQGTKRPEAVLLVRGEPGLLITCDSIQHYGDYSNNNLIARMLLPWVGFPKTTLIGPVWLKLVSPEGVSLRSEFERLLTLPFDRLFSSHGTLLENGAHAAVELAVARAFDD